MEKQIYHYSLGDFCQKFTTTQSEYLDIQQKFQTIDLSYYALDKSERDTVILGILKDIKKFSVVGEHRNELWERCWKDTHAQFNDSKGDPKTLNPQFMGNETIFRLDGDFISPLSKQFEFHIFNMLRHLLFRRYLKEADHMMEFGCGSGFNLHAAAMMYPTMSITGLDWSPSSVKIADQMGEINNLKIKGHHFDFFNPDKDFSLPPQTVAMTFAALEQTGDRFSIFTEWLLSQNPSLVISMEPILDFYDEHSLIDHTAIEYHRHRHYLSGYVTWLKDKEKQRKIDILELFRPKFGSKYHEGYSIIVWRPI
jgi:hypothetical protein